MDRAVAGAIVAGCVLLMVVWAGAVRVFVRLTRPRLGTAPASPELLDTPPAVVNLLAHGFVGAPEAAAATLLDLAVRRYIALEQPGADPSETVVRVLNTNTAGLNAYELRVLDRVQRPPGAALPALADLARRHADDGQEWHRRLEGEVRAEADRLGLIRTGGTSPGSVLLIVGLMVGMLASCACGPAALFAMWPAVLELNSDVTGLLALAATGVGALTLIFIVIALTGVVPDERYTAAGRQVARRWGAVSRWLRGHEAFGELPPAAVTAWERYLAYGVALGAAPVAAATIDLRVGRVDLIASTHGGHSRLIRVRYPRGRRGNAPSGVRLLSALGGLALLAALAWSFRGELLSLPEAAQAAIVVLITLLAVRWVYRAVLAGADVLRPGRQTGQVVRIVPFGTFGDAQTTPQLDVLYSSRLLRPFVRRFGRPATTEDGTGLVPGYCAVIDDGRSDTVRAMTVRTKLAIQLRPGEIVDVRVQRWSGHLVAVSR